MKYMIFEDFSGKPVPFIFPRRVDFEEMRPQLPYSTVLAAGYVQLGEGGIEVSGASKALGVGSRPEDAQIITERLRRAHEVL